MEGLHLLADVAIADYQLHMITHRNHDFGDRNDDDSTKKKQKTQFPDVLVSEPSLKARNCGPLDQETCKFSDLNLLADVAAAPSSSSLLDDWDYNATYTTNKNKKQKPRSSVNATSWSLQVKNSNLKLCFKKNNNTLVPSTQTSSSPSFSCHPIDLLAQVAFAYKTSILWALYANTIPTKRRSTYSRRPDRKFKHFPTTPIAGTKRGFVEINTSKKEAEETQRRNSFNKRRRVTQSLPVQLSNYLATKNGVSDPKLVIIKQLYGTDLSPQQGRFSIPANQVIDRDFLTPEARRRLDNREAICVTLIQPCLEETPMQLKKWMMNEIGIYVLNKGWNSVIRNRKNRLHLNSTVELWFFTCNGGRIYFALTTGDKDIHPTLCAGSRRYGNSGDLIGDMEPTCDDESTITIQEDV